MMSGAIALAAAAMGNRVAWVAPTYKQSRPLWRWAERTAATVGVVSRSERTITFGEGFVGVYSADNADSMRGESFHLAIVDEASRVNEDVWTDVIQPTLADFAGDAILISTPKGRNWFWREWARGQTGAGMCASFTAPTSDNPNPNIKHAAQLAKEQVSERTYRQEWLAEFVDDGGGVFRHVRQAVRAQPQDKAIEGHTYVGGLDWALSVDSTVFTVVDATTKDVAFIDRFNGVEYAMQRQRIKAVAERFNVRTIIAEENAMGKPNNDELRRMGVRVRDFTTTNATKSDLIEVLASAFEHGAIGLYEFAPLIAELEAFESERLPSGGVRYAAPQGMHDDTVMSLALAWHGAAQGRPLISFG